MVNRTQDVGTVHLQYPDTGCRMAREHGYYGGCLDCPFSDCFEDENITVKSYRKKMRDADIRGDYRRGISIEELAESYGVSTRTVQRAINGNGNS